MMLTLILGLMLPWLAGVLLLAGAREAQHKLPHPGRIFRLLGYGFLLGFALLYTLLVASNSLLGSIVVTQVLGGLLALAMLGAGSLIICRNTGKLITALQTPEPPSLSPSAGNSWLSILLLGLIGLHLLFALLDVLTTNVYPWDAWLVWIYRAKAWFLSEGLVAVTGAEQWITSDSASTFTIPAHSYPDFLSILGYWVALCLGQWSETLVNLPGILCGIAIAFALFGHALKLGLGAGYGLALCYLLISTPLFGTHISLGGYSDLWMAGYSGLGLLALLSGITSGQRNYILLGAVLLVFSTQVKNEGVVWCAIGVSLLAMSYVPRKLLWTATGLILMLSTLWVFNDLRLPGVGEAVLEGGSLLLPSLGQAEFRWNNVAPSYLNNFFLLGSWHLIWPMLIAALIVIQVQANDRARIPVLGLAALLAASQVFIFGFSQHAQWAENYTAINRLPLQLLPALLFCIAIAIEKSSRPDGGLPKPRIPLRAALGGFVLLVCLASAYLLTVLPKTLSLEPDLQFVMGSGTVEDSLIKVENFDQGFALLSSGPVDIPTDLYTHLRVELDRPTEGRAEQQPYFFWRAAEQTEKVSRLGLDDRRSYRLEKLNGWKGRISEFGVLLPDPGHRASPTIRVSLFTPSFGNSVRLLINNWLSFEPRTLRSINFIQGGLKDPLIPLPLFILAWVISTMILMGMPWFIQDTPSFPRVAIIMLAAWMMLDARWLLNSARQAVLSVENGWALSDSERFSRAPDQEIWALTERFRSKTPDSASRRLLIIGDGEKFRYMMERAKYHLLPDSALIAPSLSRGFENARIDYVLFINDFSLDENWQSSWSRLPMSENWRDKLELMDASPIAALFTVKH